MLYISLKVIAEADAVNSELNQFRFVKCQVQPFYKWSFLISFYTVFIMRVFTSAVYRMWTQYQSVNESYQQQTVQHVTYAACISAIW